MRNRMLEMILVGVQVGSIGYLVLDTSWRTLPGWAIAIAIASGLLAIWAILTMKLDNLRITPTPGDQARLVTDGPYRMIRHPMYTSLLILAVPLLVDQFNLIRLTVTIVLLLDLLIKLQVEERMLLEKFPEYDRYREKTWRIVPYLW